MKFAFIIMGNFDPAVDKAEIGGGKRQIVGVNNMNRALDAACRLRFSRHFFESGGVPTGTGGNLAASGAI